MMNKTPWCIFLLVVLLPWSAHPAAAQRPVTVAFLAGAGGIGDESYNDMTMAGLAEANRSFGVRIICESSDETRAGIKTALERFIAAGAEIIVSNRIAFPDIINAFARQHPEKHFILNDMPWMGLANVASLGYATNEGSFLAGALAGWMTHSGKVAFIGGNHLPGIESFYIGFGEGVHYANPEVQLLEVRLAQGEDASGFNSPHSGYEAAMYLYRQDVDIIFASAGLSGNGVIQAAKAANRYVIGVDTDQDHMARGHVLTSMMKRQDKATYQEVAAVLQGSFQPGLKFFSLDHDGVGLSPMRYTKSLISQAVLDNLERIKTMIISGEIQVTAIDYLNPTP